MKKEDDNLRVNCPCPLLKAGEAIELTKYGKAIISIERLHALNNLAKIHNNPEYHVRKKSDVDGDVMGALDMIKNPTFQINQTTNTLSMHINCSYDKACKNINILRNALIAQSDPDMVRMKKALEIAGIALASMAPDVIYDSPDLIAKEAIEAINDVLNYKDGE